MRLRRSEFYFLRTPIRLLVNRITCRSMYVDHQQGGVLTDTFTETQGNDSYGEMTYEGVYTYDTDWRRRSVLTEEGFLVVVDAFLPGEAADGMVGGSVWQLQNSPEHSGLFWYDAVADKAENQNLMVYFHPQRGHEYGTQTQPKHGWEPKHWAVFDKAKLQAGEKEYFVSVMVPHESGIKPSEISGKHNEGARVIASGEENQGIVTAVSDSGDVDVKIHPWKDEQNNTIKINVLNNGNWSVKR